MCGITGIISKTEHELHNYYEAHKLIGHRGPDGEGFATLQIDKLLQSHGDKSPETIKSKSTHISTQKSSLVLGHHRLKVIDLSDSSHQPFISEDHNVALTFNGEVYNYKEIKEKLISKGHRFNSTGDAEVVLKSYIEWGSKCFEKFNGMWAIVIFDLREKQLILSRDRFGVKPLFYNKSKDNLMFASEVRFLKKLLPVLSIESNKALDFLNYSRIHTDENTLYSEINSVKAGTYVVIDYDLTFNEFPYWTLKESETKYLEVDAINELSKIFSSSIDLRLRSDVPVGTLLSGGLDSNMIVGNVLSRNRRQELSSFSAVFNEKKFSEKLYIDKTIQKFPNINSHFIYPSPEGLKKDITKLLNVQEFPIRSLAVYSQYKIYEYIKSNSNITVLLNGQGSDEIFSGYSQHYYYHFLDLLLSGKLKQFKEESLRLQKTRNISTISLIRSLILSFSELTGMLNIKNNIGSNKLNTSYQMAQLLNGRSRLNSVLKTNLLSYSLPEYLTYEDKNSMSHSLESRLPFLDYRLVEYAFSLPSSLKINTKSNKYLPRQVAKNYIDPFILNRNDKMGFISPQQIWQKTHLKDFLKETILDGEGVYNLNFSEIEKGFTNYLNGKNNDWTFWWRIFCFKKWQSILK